MTWQRADVPAQLVPLQTWTVTSVVVGSPRRLVVVGCAPSRVLTKVFRWKVVG
jgi:hypothetical protein